MEERVLLFWNCQIVAGDGEMQHLSTWIMCEKNEPQIKKLDAELSKLGELIGTISTALCDLKKFEGIWHEIWHTEK